LGCLDWPTDGPYFSQNAPSFPGLGDADMARGRRPGVIVVAANFQLCDNARDTVDPMHSFREIRADGRHAVSTPGDLLFHIRAKRMDLCFELAPPTKAQTN
jgi:deferrochelatase/peroxidase EfeB